MTKYFKNLFFAVVLLTFVVLNYNLEVQANDCQVELSEQEYTCIEDLIFEKLKITDFTFEIISGFQADNRYVLIEGQNCYLIYDRVLCDYVEYSLYSNSIYYNLNSNIQKIYLGTTYYFYKDGETYYNIINNQVLSEQELNSYIQFENNRLQSLSLHEINLVNEINDTQATTTLSTTEIDSSYYYQNLNENFPTNINGSCSYVAAAMLLSYYDSVVNDNIISDTYDDVVDENFQYYSLVNSQSFISSPGVTEAFQDELIELGRNLGLTATNGWTMSISETVSLMEFYLSDQDISYNTYYSGHLSSQSDYVSFCKTAIDNDCPVIIQIIGCDASISTEDINHAVVGYGYDSTGIIVHFGLRNFPYYVNINNYTISHAMYVDITESHVCSDNYEWSANGCTGTVCPCGIKTCNHETLNYEYRTSSDHIVSCNACNYSYIEEHDDLAYESITSTHHKVSCLTCEDYYYELHDYVVEGDIQTCTECGHQEEICYHENLTYENYTSAYHNVNCANCDYSYTEEHDIYVQDHTQYCSKCDYEHVLSVGHNYIYIPITGGKNHKKQCSICSSYTIEACIALGQAGSTTRTCALCGQTMNSNIGFVPLKKDEDEIVE